jgi:hypothetical protein
MVIEQKERAKIQNRVTTCEENHAKKSSESISEDINTSIVRNSFTEDSTTTTHTLLNQDNQTREEKSKGIVYISRVPCFMNATKLRQYMENFGKVHRIFLTPENPGKTMIL